MVSLFNMTAIPNVQPKRFTVDEYHRLAELGFLGEDDHIELIRGELIQRAAKGVRHEFCLRRLLRQLPRLIGDRATLQCQAPITLSFDGEPEPDFAILRNREDDYATAHPTPEDVWLVIEIADSSLDYDQTVKLPLYAEAAIAEYWIFNLVDRQLEVYTEPSQVGDSFDYLNRRIVPPDGTVGLGALAAQEKQVNTDRLLLSEIFAG